MSVIIDPTDLGFRRPFSVEVSETLKIKNPNPVPVAFKVKTTAPKQAPISSSSSWEVAVDLGQFAHTVFFTTGTGVRPNSGRIEADHTVEVTVLLQAMKTDPAPDYRCRDKFLVQSVPITGDREFIPLSDIWDHVEKSAIQEKKIRVSFLPAQDGDAHTPARAVAANGYDTTATPDAAPPAYNSPLEGSRTFDSEAGAVKSPLDSKRDISKGAEETLGAAAVAAPLAATAAVASAASAASSSPFSSTSSPTDIKSRAIDTTTSSDDKEATIASLKSKLAAAEAEIATLKQDSGLRQRKVAGVGSTDASESTDGSTTVTSEKGGALSQTVRQGTEGVPVKVVALLCLLCFLLAYFFF